MSDTSPSTRRRGGDAALIVVVLVAVVAGVLCYALRGSEVFFAVLGDDLRLLLSIVPKVVAGVLLAGLLTVLLPQEKVARWMGSRSGLRGLVLAAAAGALLPGGPMMAFPLTVALRSAGADIGTVTAFLAGWSLLGLNRTLVWEMSFFDPDFVLLRYSLSLAMPLLLGLGARLIFAPRKEPTEDEPAKSEGGAE